MNTRRLTCKDITLFTLSAVLAIDGLAATASIGVQSLAWWFIAFVFFVIPYRHLNPSQWLVFFA